MRDQLQMPVFFKALDSARDGITISDATKPDMPLVYVNEGFVKMTGYTSAEVLGRNCRFLQGNDTNQRGVISLREAMSKKEAVVVTLLNYRKDGKPFWNKLSLTPIFDNAGTLTHFIGVQDDITLEKEKTALEQKVEQHKLVTAATIKAQEQERQHIGAELHDNINQLLTSAKLLLDMAASDETLRLRMIEGSNDIIQKTISEVRKLSHALIGPKTDGLRLQDSLKDLVNVIDAGAAFSVSFHCKEMDENSISESKKLVVYRIVQEQLNNIIKHAGAKHVTVSIQGIANQLQLSIKDDGVGFDKTQGAKGVGLRNIETRLEMVNGKMHLITNKGKGCNMMVHMPLG